MHKIQTAHDLIHFGETGYKALNQMIRQINPSLLIILADDNTFAQCYPRFIPQLEVNVPIEVIAIDAGEQHKNIETCAGVWGALLELGADRHSLMINLGGGVVTDMGGFIAGTYQRGIPFVNIPTSLLAMVDASAGGKTGVDHEGVKNQVGIFCHPEMVLVDHSFLTTLPEEEFLSGTAEMAKHCLLSGTDLWDAFRRKAITPTSIDLPGLIHQSIMIKSQIVQEDVKEQGVRKTLNLGHTVGHAVESFLMLSPTHDPLPHGHCVATGICIESCIASTHAGLSMDVLSQIKEWYTAFDLDLRFNSAEVEVIYQLMQKDKKNKAKAIKAVLLAGLGHPKMDQAIDLPMLLKAMQTSGFMK